MKAKWVVCGWVTGMLLLLRTAPARGEDASVRPEIGPGVLVSPGFHEYMGDLSSDGDAASAWAVFHISAKIGLSDRWSLVPVLDLCANGNGDGGGLENGMQILGVNVRRTFGDRSAFHVQAGPSLVLASGGGHDADFEGGNLGGEASIGYGFRIRSARFGPEVGLGYSYCPVDATRMSDHETTTENFGGPFFRVGFRF
jgi:hypothetical protein